MLPILCGRCSTYSHETQCDCTRYYYWFTKDEVESKGDTDFIYARNRMAASEGVARRKNVREDIEIWVKKEGSSVVANIHVGVKIIIEYNGETNWGQRKSR